MNKYLKDIKKARQHDAECRKLGFRLAFACLLVVLVFNFTFVGA